MPTIMNTPINRRNFGIVDFHTHILDGIDDGAKNIDESIELIKEEINQGVNTIVLTPHFYPETDDYQTFLLQRKNTYQQLKNKVKEEALPIQLILGAEIKFSPKLLDLDLLPFCIANTNFLLIEFSMSHFHNWTKDVFFQLQSKGFHPIIAHAERYTNLPTSSLLELVQAGAFVQINTSSILRPQTYKKVKQLIKQNLVHTYGTDTHSIEKRPPTHKQAFELLAISFGEKHITDTSRWTNDILNDILPLPPAPTTKRKFFSFL